MAEICITTKLENKYPEARDIVLVTTVLDRVGNVIAKQERDCKINPTGIFKVEQNLKMKNPHLWHGRKDPYLYKVVTQVRMKGVVIDEIVQPLDLHYYQIDKDKGFILYGKPYRLFGVCRHQEWQDFGNALSDVQHRTDMMLIYEMGATALRLAHYQQAEYVYSLCDSLGFVVWAEIPFINTWSGQKSENAKQQLIELIRQNYNHPSIIMLGLHNEVHNRPDHMIILPSSPAS